MNCNVSTSISRYVQSMDFVGLMEAMVDTERIVRAMTGWPQELWSSSGTTKKPPAAHGVRSKLTPATIAAIERLQQHDMQLYAQAQHHFRASKHRVLGDVD